MRTVTLCLVLACLPVLAGSSCSGDTRPNVPETVRVPVKEMIPVPAWATDPLPKPQPVDGTVEARAVSHDARGAVIEMADCHRRLVAHLGRGEAVDPKECEL